MRHAVLAAAIASLFQGAAHAQAADPSAILLDSKDYRLGAANYDHIVELGVVAARGGNYAGALQLIEVADKSAVPDKARFRLMPLIAWLRLKAGDAKGAAEMRDDALEVVEVMTGQAACPEFDAIVRNQQPGPTINFGGRVASRVCGGLVHADALKFGRRSNLFGRFNQQIDFVTDSLASEGAASDKQ